MDYQFLGHIEGVRYTETSVVIVACERRKGYKKKDGTIVDDELLTFRFLFNNNYRKYISEHFSRGMLVKIKGFMLPYAKDHEGHIIDGFTCIGQCIEIASYPSNNVRIEKRMVKESQKTSTETPRLEEFESPDF